MASFEVGSRGPAAITLAIVVPCFNEERRLAVGLFGDLERQLGDVGIEATFVLVDDGSTDATGDVISVALGAGRFSGELLRLEQNVGKAEAVRAGMRHQRAVAADLIAFMDADGAVPTEAVVAFVRTALLYPGVDAFLASRIRLMGSRINRRASRHALGRIVAQIIRWRFHADVYDSQCGLKLFRNSVALRDSLVDPFRSRWFVDVELIHRLSNAVGPGTPAVRSMEIPVYAWHDVAQSSVRPLFAIREIIEISRARFFDQQGTNSVPRRHGHSGAAQPGRPDTQGSGLRIEGGS